MLEVGLVRGGSGYRSSALRSLGEVHRSRATEEGAGAEGNAVLAGPRGTGWSLVSGQVPPSEAASSSRRSSAPPPPSLHCCLETRSPAGECGSGGWLAGKGLNGCHKIGAEVAAINGAVIK